MRRLLLIFLFTSPGLFSFSPGGNDDSSWRETSQQEVAGVLKQAASWYSQNNSYAVTVRYRSYETYTSMVPHDESTGYIKKNKNCYHSFMLGIHTIQNDRVRLIVDSVHQLILIGSPEKDIDPVFNEKAFSSQLDQCRSFKIGGKVEKRVRFEYKAGEIAASELYLDKDGRLKDLKLFYGVDVKSNPDDEKLKATKPRVEVSYYGFKKEPSLNYQEEFSETKYMTLKGSTYYPTEKYDGYKVSDLRVKK